jgi:hypothetical protein
MLIILNVLLLLGTTSSLIYRHEIIVSSKEIEEIFEDDQNPFSPLVLCHFL